MYIGTGTCGQDSTRTRPLGGLAVHSHTQDIHTMQLLTEVRDRILRRPLWKQKGLCNDSDTSSDRKQLHRVTWSEIPHQAGH